MNQRLSNILGTKYGNSVIKSTVIDTVTGEIRTWTTREDVENANLQYLPSLLLSANDTPLRTAPLVNIIGYTGDTIAGEQITEGTFETPSCVDKYTKLFLQCLKKGDNVKDGEIQFKPTLQHFVHEWSKRRERTSSSVSGRHFGHYKCIQHHKERIQRMFLTMAVIPYRSGFSPKRWEEAVDILIMKKDNDHRVHRTRPISLLEADSNNNAKLLSTVISCYAEEKQLFANEQYGSRQHRSSIHLATNKKLIYDISRQMKQPIAVCSNDAR